MKTGYAPFDALGCFVRSENFETDPTWDVVPDAYRKNGNHLIAGMVGKVPFVMAVYRGNERLWSKFFIDRWDSKIRIASFRKVFDAMEKFAIA